MTTAPAVRNADLGGRGSRPQLPHVRTVLLEQVRVTGLALRRPALIAATLVALLTAFGMLQIVSKRMVVSVPAWPTMLPGLVGALLPGTVWARDDHFGPAFLWMLPVDRRRHALIKVLAGWVWLVGGMLLLALWLLALTLATGGRVLPTETLRVVTPHATAAGALDPAALQTVRWAPGPLIRAVPFTAATAGYVLASALVLGSRHPLRWVIGVLVAYPIASAPCEAAGAGLGVGWLADAPGRLVRLIVSSRYGLDALLTARTESLSAPATLTTGAQVAVWRAVPDLADWRTATLLWTGLGLVALWAAASRHRERRRA